MAIPQKGSRPIVIDGIQYRWLIRRKATYSQVDYGSGFLHVAVELAENPGTTLVIFTHLKHPRDWATEKAEAITPKRVSAWISQALSLGWYPEKQGAQFWVKIETDERMKVMG